MGEERYVLDCGVIVEYIVEDSPYPVEPLFRSIEAGEVEAMVTPVTLSEVVYTSDRLYREAGVESPNEEALKFVNWLVSLQGISLIPLDLPTALRVGELKKRFRLSLADLTVLASAVERGAAPLFLKPEREMLPYIAELVEMGVKFWSNRGRRGQENRSGRAPPRPI